MSGLRMHAFSLSQLAQALTQPNLRVRQAPLTRLNYEITQVLAAHRFIDSFEVVPEKFGKIIIRGHVPTVKILSRPGQRVFFDYETLIGKRDTFRYLELRSSTALTILRTPLGIRSLAAAKYLRTGGEPLLLAKLD
eukprot:Opistho-2@61776